MRILGFQTRVGRTCRPGTVLGGSQAPARAAPSPALPAGSQLWPGSALHGCPQTARKPGATVCQVSPGWEQAGACPSTGLVGEDGDWMWPGISRGSVTVPGHTLWPTAVRWTVRQTRAPCQGPGGQEQARGPWGARRPQPQSSGTPARSSMPGGACSWATPCVPTSPNPHPKFLFPKRTLLPPSCGLSGGRPGSIGGPSAAPQESGSPFALGLDGAAAGGGHTGSGRSQGSPRGLVLGL